MLRTHTLLSDTFTRRNTTSVSLCRQCIMTADVEGVFLCKLFRDLNQIFAYDICTCVQTGLCFNLASCSYSSGGLQVKGALILILLRTCRPASESLKLTD